MAKDPAFLFYPGDWLGGTMGMTFEQKGAYFELLIFQFNNGPFTEAQAQQVLSTCPASTWQVVRHKFSKIGDRFQNKRLAGEIEKRQQFSESRRNNAKSKKITPKKQKAYAQHMEDENENRDVIEIGTKKESSIVIRVVYAGEKPRRIYDLKEYFKQKGQLNDIQRAGWVSKFDAFMKENPGRVFDNDNHLYNTLKNFSINDRRTGKTAVNGTPGAKFSGDYTEPV